MDWTPQSPDLNLIENLCSIIKRKICVDGHQFSSKKDLWKKIQEASSQTSSKEVQNFTSSVDRRLMELIMINGKRVKG